MADMDYEQEPQVLIMEPRVKPGYATTEFWATIALAAGAVTVSFDIDAEWASALALGFGATVIAVYDFVRMVVKKNAKP